MLTERRQWRLNLWGKMQRKKLLVAGWLMGSMLLTLEIYGAQTEQRGGKRQLGRGFWVSATVESKQNETAN